MQISARAMMSFLAQQWAALHTAYKTSWETLAQTLGLPPYNAYLSVNLERWAQFKAPSKTHPITGIGTLPTADFNSATGHPGYATLNFTIDRDRDGWALLIFRSTTSPVVPSLQNCVAVLLTVETDPFLYDDKALDPGTYFWQARFCTHQGKMGPNETQRTAVVT